MTSTLFLVHCDDCDGTGEVCEGPLHYERMERCPTCNGAKTLLVANPYDYVRSTYLSFPPATFAAPDFGLPT